MLPVLLAGVLAQAHAAQEPAPARVTLGPENFREWMQAIQPSAQETAYRAIPWRSALWPSVQEARELGRPILLWAMNGHPLGCT